MTRAPELLLATRSPEIAFVRKQVPEFERAFQEELQSEKGELDPYEAMSLLASWIDVQLKADEAVPSSVPRAFAAVERVYVDHTFRLGGDLAVDFLETVCSNPALHAPAMEHMAAGGQEWLLTFCPAAEDAWTPPRGRSGDYVLLRSGLSEVRAIWSRPIEAALSRWAADWIAQYSLALTEVDRYDRANFAYLVLDRPPGAGDILGGVDENSAVCEFGWGSPPSSPEAWPLMAVQDLLAAGALLLREGNAESRT